MNHPHLPTIARINELYASLRKPKILLYRVKTARKIGLLLETILGKNRSWDTVFYAMAYRNPKSAGFIGMLPFGFAQAKVALKIYQTAPANLGFKAASRFAGELEILCGVEPRKAIAVKQRAVSPAVAVYNALEQARVAVRKQTATFGELDEAMRLNIAQSIIQHREWVKEIIDSLALAEVFAREQKPDGVWDGTLGRFIRAEL